MTTNMKINSKYKQTKFYLKAKTLMSTNDWRKLEETVIYL